MYTLREPAAWTPVDAADYLLRFRWFSSSVFAEGRVSWLTIQAGTRHKQTSEASDTKVCTRHESSDIESRTE